MTLSLIGSSVSDVLVHFAPSHCTTEMRLCPLWSLQLRWIGAAKPGRPSSFHRASVILSDSKPRRRSTYPFVHQSFFQCHAGRTKRASAVHPFGGFFGEPKMLILP